MEGCSRNIYGYCFFSIKSYTKKCHIPWNSKNEVTENRLDVLCRNSDYHMQ